jgi:hypothetical protein
MAKHDNFMDFFNSIEDKTGFQSMNEVIPMLWIGSSAASLAYSYLKTCGIKKILCANGDSPQFPDVSLAFINSLFTW